MCGFSLEAILVTLLPMAWGYLLWNIICYPNKNYSVFVNCFLNKATKSVSNTFSHRIHKHGSSCCKGRCDRRPLRISQWQLRMLGIQSGIQWLGHKQELSEGLNAAITVAFSAAPLHPRVTFCLPCLLRTEKLFVVFPNFYIRTIPGWDLSVLWLDDHEYLFHWYTEITRT